MKHIIKILVFIFFVQFISCNTDNDSKYQEVPALLLPENGEEYSGGQATVFNSSEEAFGFFARNLTQEEQTDFGMGNSFFRQSWVSAPASTTARDGLGPFFNAVSCSSCHFKDGRGRPPAFDGELGRGLLLRLSLAGNHPNGSSFSDPIYGGQLQDNAVLGQTVKGKYTITYQLISETLADGTVIQLRKPIYQINNLGYGALAGGVLVSPRIANQMIGLGLLEAVPESTILGFIATNNSNEISGKANYVYDVESNSQKLGRFGWKANQPTIRQQAAGAFSGDMGITTSIFPNENAPPSVNLNTIPNGGSPEISDDNLAKVVLYSSSLAVPARRNYTEQNVLKGKKIFQEINCTACHVPKIQTSTNYPILAFRNQTIRPYTDLLLHDMGEELSDNASDFLANGNEWRTQPLWGIGLINTVNGHTNLLHDGRARNITEAILWHGGEAQTAKLKFKQLTTIDRNNLLEFINSL
ncbi:c-type cytochrome [Flavobacterium psychrophilum]|uniref:di-heme oxidoreductase family protein n=1 Tax=Flavobacterium psychrophilum TaxID=96345 RepID=UPI0004F5B208|nr:di-heme oxidoredictase family protein [Flavobacterium psychrophilum]AIN73677.1 thiol oxidoreductase [Flavobacterium psychrophilum FPG3]EKT2069796.1 c-type cytochrome [Flavobacterium psychrophilum]EKT2072056.1 c-type cytochrome [Flavobacterium psychrophilum]EKT4491578.1 c-type cytochrome [Flavobacterium psychrophilum]MBF2045755.1 c-type cytochrome [Flavobacterium psychrophilum]